MLDLETARELVRRPPSLTDVTAAARARWTLRHADHVGERVRLRGRALVVARGKLSIGERVQIVSTTARTEIVSDIGAELTIGARTLVNFGTSIIANERIEIGPRCLIGTGCLILDTPFHNIDPERRLDPPPTAPVSIGENVWLGARVVVLPGVTIGRDSVIGVGSVVTKDVPPRTLATGVPATVTREI